MTSGRIAYVLCGIAAVAAVAAVLSDSSGVATEPTEGQLRAIAAERFFYWATCQDAGLQSRRAWGEPCLGWREFLSLIYTSDYNGIRDANIAKMTATFHERFPFLYKDIVVNHTHTSGHVSHRDNFAVVRTVNVRAVSFLLGDEMAPVWDRVETQDAYRAANDCQHRDYAYETCSPIQWFAYRLGMYAMSLTTSWPTGYKIFLGHCEAGFKDLTEWQRLGYKYNFLGEPQGIMSSAWVRSHMNSVVTACYVKTVNEGCDTLGLGLFYTKLGGDKLMRDMPPAPVTGNTGVAVSRVRRASQAVANGVNGYKTAIQRLKDAQTTLMRLRDAGALPNNETLRKACYQVLDHRFVKLNTDRIYDSKWSLLDAIEPAIKALETERADPWWQLSPPTLAEIDAGLEFVRAQKAFCDSQSAEVDVLNRAADAAEPPEELLTYAKWVLDQEENN